jgi:hypothetical protein
VAHAYNPNYSGGRDPEDDSLRPAQQGGREGGRVLKILPQPIKAGHGGAPVIPAMGEHKQDAVVQDGPGINERPY